MLMSVGSKKWGQTPLCNNSSGHGAYQTISQTRRKYVPVSSSPATPAGHGLVNSLVRSFSLQPVRIFAASANITVQA